MPSDAMKARATQRVDLSGPASKRNIRGDVGVDVLVGPDGAVICTAGYLGHPMVLEDVEEAVRQWKFTPLKENNKPVAFVGNLQTVRAGFSRTWSDAGSPDRSPGR